MENLKNKILSRIAEIDMLSAVEDVGLDDLSIWELLIKKEAYTEVLEMLAEDSHE